MSYIDDDLTKLKHYAKSLGLTVKIVPADKSIDCSAVYIAEDKQVILYQFKGRSKTFMVLCLLHELGHHREFLDRSKKDTETLIDALNAEKPNKSQRAAIYVSECNAAVYMVIIRDELSLKIPRYKVMAESQLDAFVAESFYINGKHNTQKVNKEKRKQLRKEYKDACTRTFE